MKAPWVVAVIALVAGLASAGPSKLQAYEGQLVISPDPAPSSADELPGYLKANATADHHYELIKGPPWEVNLVAVLAKESGSVTLVFALASDKQLTAIQSLDVPVKNGLVLAHTVATVAAGFELNQTYVVRLMRKTKVIARAELKLRG